MFKVRMSLFACLALGMVFSVPASAQNIITVAGGGPNNAPAVSANLNGPIGVAVDASGNVYVAIHYFKLFRVDTRGQLTLYAGDGFSEADGIPATSANLCLVGMAADRAGNVFIADPCTNRVRRIDGATQTITTVAGGGSGGDGGPATAAALSGPGALTIDSSGNLFIAEGEGGIGKIRRVDAATHVITTVANANASGMAVDSAGNLFFTNDASHLVYRVDATTRATTTVAGNGYQDPYNSYYGGYSGDGGPATSAALNHPMGIAVDGAGNLFIADAFNGRIRRVDAATQVITTAAGNCTTNCTGLGDGGPATSAVLIDPTGVAINSAGDLLIVDAGENRIRRVDGATQVVTTAAGNGSCCFSGDGGPATSADGASGSIALDSAGNLFIGNGSLVRRVDASTQVISTVAGTEHPQSLGEGGPATSAYLNFVADIAFDSAGSLFIVDEHEHLVRRVDAATQVITTIAGKIGSNCFPCAGFSGDGGLATAALLAYPDGVAVDGAGNLFISDGNNERVRRVDASTRVINTYTGNGYQSYGGDGGPATSAELNGPYGLATDKAGNLFIADEANHRIRRVDAATGVITTVAGNGYRDPSNPYGDVGGFSGDGGPATSAELNEPTGVAVDGAGNLFIADYGNNRIRRVDAATQVITTVAGGGATGCSLCGGGFSGDGGPATSAELNSPKGIAVDGAGNLFIADNGNNRIREVVASKQATSVAVSSSANPSVVGQAVTLTATVHPSSGSSVPTGTITFTDAANTLGTAALSGGQAAFLLSSPNIGAHSIMAVYSGDDSFLGSTSSAFTQTVNKASATTVLSSSATQSTLGQAVTFSAAVSPLSPGAGTPSGTITFTDGANPLGTVPLNSSGSATITASALAVAAHPITATYSGDNGFFGSNGSLTENVSYAIRPLYDQTRSVNGGAAFPIQLYLCDVGGNDVSSAAITLHVTQVTGGSGYSGGAASPGNANPGGNFRLDASLGPAGGYIFNLKTTGLAPGRYTLQFTAGSDPVPHAANFTVR